MCDNFSQYPLPSFTDTEIQGQLHMVYPSHSGEQEKHGPEHTVGEMMIKATGIYLSISSCVKGNYHWTQRWYQKIVHLNNKERNPYQSQPLFSGGCIKRMAKSRAKGEQDTDLFSMRTTSICRERTMKTEK